MAEKNQIQLLYITYFNRAADAEGLAYWSARLESGEPFFMIQAAFSNPEVAEAAAAYAVLSQPSDFVAQAYQNLLNRLPDEGGLAYWTSRIQEDMTNGSSLMEAGIGLLGAFMAAAGASPGLDANTVTAKITVANAITEAASTDSAKLLELSALYLGQETLGQLETQQLDALLSAIRGNMPEDKAPAPSPNPPAPIPAPQPEPKIEPFDWKLLASVSYTDGYRTKEAPFISDGTWQGSFALDHLYHEYFFRSDSHETWVVNNNGFATSLYASGLDSSGGSGYSKSSMHSKGGWITDGTVHGTQHLPFGEIEYGVNAHLSLNEWIIAIGENGFYAKSDYLENGVGSIRTPANYLAYPGSDLLEGDLVVSPENGTVWYTGHTSPYGRELYSLRTTNDSVITTRLTDIFPGEGSGVRDLNNAILTNAGQLVFFGWKNTSSSPNQIWVSDGTKEGTHIAIAYENNAYSAYYDGFVSMHLAGKNSSELIVVERKYPGEGVYLLDIQNGERTEITGNFDSWSYSYLGNIEGSIYFSGAKEGSQHLYRYGPEIGLEKMGFVSMEASLIQFTETSAYFLDHDANHGRELWKLDFITGVYELHQDFLPGSGSGNPKNLYSPSTLIHENLIISAYINDLDTATFAVHSSGEPIFLFEGKVQNFKTLSDGVIAFGENNEIWYINKSAENSINKTKITDAHFSYIHNSDIIYFGDDALFYVTQNEVDQLNKFCTHSLTSSVIFEGSIHQFKPFSDDTVFISDTNGGLHVYSKTENGSETRIVTDHGDGVINLIGAAILYESTSPIV